jgi:quinol-cytochrome oxidoreductase complex cytochrome b subunit
MGTDTTQDTAGAKPDHGAGHPFYPHHILDEMLIIVGLAGVVLTLAILLPFHLHEKADPMFTPPGIKPEWYFLPMYQAIKYVPRTLGVIATGLVFVLIVVWPFVDMLLDRLSPRRPLYRVAAVLGIAAALIFGGLGYISERNVSVFGREYHIDLKGVPHPVVRGQTESHAPQQHQP